MPRPQPHVTCREPELARIPDALLEGATLFLVLQQLGTLDRIAEQLQIRRQGGYCGFDAYLMLLLYVCAGPCLSIKDLWQERVRPHVAELAALAGRRSLPSPSSMTRLLQAVQFDTLRPIEGWLLSGLCNADPLLSHPAGMATDAQGDRWQIFDLDPTVVTLRQRALPADEDLPPPVRRAEHTGAPGYAGRKRGDIQYRQTTVQHAGARLWVHAQLSVGNGDGLLDCEAALDTVGQTLDRLGHPRERSMTRMDGAYGNVPWFAACIERQLPFVTRLNRPQLYEVPEILAQLREAVAYAVPDSRSGPRRAAIELGWREVLPGTKTRRPDGSPYASVTVRVVASLYPAEQPGKRGRWIDGWQVELFATTLPEPAWPAEQVVVAYFSRAGQENGFAQEDREMLLSRIASYHLPGQELAVVVGLSAWNLRVVGGFEQQLPLDTPPLPGPAPRVIDERRTASWPRDPVVAAQLSQLDWASLLDKRQGWSFLETIGALRCPAGRELPLTTVRKSEEGSGRTGLIFVRPAHGCADCSVRTPCLRSERPDAVKHAEVSIPTEVATELRRRLDEVRHGSKTPPASAAGPRPCQFSLFLAASARQLYRAALHDATLRVWVKWAPTPSRPLLLARDDADRQRRRQTWEQQVARYALPEDAQVHIEVCGSRALQERLGHATSPTVASGGTG